MKPGLSRAATVMGAATALSRVLGFGRVLVIAAVIGTTDLGNIFSASNSVSNVLFDLLAARALPTQPLAHLMDEPCAAQDPHATRHG